MFDTISKEIQARAAWHLERFTTGERVSADTGRKIIVLLEVDPDTGAQILGDMSHPTATLAREAHGDMFPDDFRYEFIRDALGAIMDASEGADPGDVGAEYADGAVDVYNAARLRWLASHLDRPGYVDQAREDFGAEGDTVDQVGMGQYMEACEVFGLVFAFIAREVAEAEETDAEADDLDAVP